jgi:hypothetical protein
LPQRVRLAQRLCLCLHQYLLEGHTLALELGLYHHMVR